MSPAPPFPLHGAVPESLVELCRARSTAEARVVDVRVSAGLFSVCLRTPRGTLYLRVDAEGRQRRVSPYGIEQVVYGWLEGWPIREEAPPTAA